MISALLAMASAVSGVTAIGMVISLRRDDRYEYDRLIWVRTRNEIPDR